MEPLINKFSKNLSGCSGCGNTDAVYQAWSKAKEKGEKMKFVFEVVVEADTYKQAVIKVPDDFEILKGTTKTEPKPPSNLPTTPTNMRTGLPVNG